MIVRTIIKGSFVVDERDPRHVGRVTKIEAERVSIHWNESAWLSVLSERVVILAPGDVIEPLQRRGMTILDLLPNAR